MPLRLCPNYLYHLRLLENMMNEKLNPQPTEKKTGF